MKIKKTGIFMFIIFACFIFGSIHASAINTGFETTELTPAECEKIKKNLSFSFLSEPPEAHTISCFDINEDGRIAIGTETTSAGRILVYTPEGQFMYGYFFDLDQSYGIEWDKENLLVYLVRSSLVVSLDKNGEIVEIREIKNTIKNNDYWNHIVFAKEREALGKRYVLQNDMGFFNWFASAYAQLMVTNADGSTKMIYDINRAYTIEVVLMFVIAIIIIITAIISIVHLIKKTRKEYLKENNYI